LGRFDSLLDRLFGKRGAGGADAVSGIKKFKPELLIFGLGNPGGKYGGTRHNVGFDVVDELCAAQGGGVSAPREYCEADCRMAALGAGKKNVLLAKPLTYMNLSGDAVGLLLGKYQLPADRCLVIVDDFNIPLGKIRLRKEGSPGGHNGLKSVSEEIGQGYPRLRIGIGPLPSGISVIDFVLGRFDDAEREKIGSAIKAAAEAVMFLVENGVEAAMNRYN
jgi:PTH1 family peptidyl-tRNA hydrolase